MSDKKNIDRFFQESFKDFEVQPPSIAWDNIEKELDQKKKRKVVPIWWTIGSIAAGIAILFTSLYVGINTNSIDDGQPFVNTNKNNIEEVNSKNSSDLDNEKTSKEITLFNNENKNDTELVTEDSTIDSESWSTLNKNSNVNTRANTTLKTSDLVNSSDESSDTNFHIEEKDKKPYRSASSSKNKTNTTIAQKESNIPVPQQEKSSEFNSKNNVSKSVKEDIAINNSRENKKTYDKDSKENSVINDQLIDNAVAIIDSMKQKLPSLEDIASQERKEDSVRNTIFKRSWAASTQVGPVYSNSLSGSAINNEVSDNSKDAGLNLSYGIGLSYQLSPRLSVRTGINQINMTYNTRDINYQVNVGLASRGQSLPQSYNSASVSSVVTVNNGPITNDVTGTGFAAQELINNQFNGIKGELSQRLGYLEVPLELKYSLVNNNLKINVLGGMSALFLTDNIVAVQNPNQRLELGEDRNFNEFNQSANFGLGLGYDFTNQLGAFIEPTFKYQLSTLKNNAANFKPYTIGVQSGITYKF